MVQHNHNNIHANIAKNVPSIVGGQSLVITTCNGIVKATSSVVKSTSSPRTKAESAMPTALFQRKTNQSADVLSDEQS